MTWCRSTEQHDQRRAFPAAVTRVLASRGEPLESAMRSRLTHSFGDVGVHARPTGAPISDPSDASEREARHAAVTPPGDVIVHRGEDAVAAAESVGARAFTYGRHVVIGRGAYSHDVLAHEIAHVAQQARSGTAQLQRMVTVENPSAIAPNQGGPSTTTNAQMVALWAQLICPGGNFDVDSSGRLFSPDHAAFCGETAPQDPAARHYSRGGMYTSCNCLCLATAPTSPVVKLSLGDMLNDPQKRTGAAQIDLAKEGEGATMLAAGTAADPILMGLSNREAKTVKGGADTNPQASAGGIQTLRDPPWLIFAHELCGHVIGRAERGLLGQGHYQLPTPQTAVDVENRIRREHSVAFNNFGVRMGDQTVDQKPSVRFGAHIRLPAGRTFHQFAADMNVPKSEIFKRIFTGDGDSLFPNSLPASGDLLFVEGTAWHEVLGSESDADIAAQWGISTALLRAANPGVANWTAIAGLRLIIPRRP